jgi:Raf kinase inhibitor-like YbhB/YbcL family protein
MARAAGAVLCLVLAACGGGAPEIDAPATIELTSPTIAPGAEIPRVHTCDGEDRSPALKWNPVGGSEGYALTMTDPDARGFVHWVVYGLPASVTSLPEGEVPAEARLGTNDFGRKGYGGPCPPSGQGPHRYVITLYAHGATALPPEGATLEEVLRALADALIAKGELKATYER